MTFRSRPVLDRKHRPRWQDELRTQQLIVVGFAIAIAVAIGIFGAAAWNGYWEAHSRPVAAVAGTSFDQADLDQRETILTMELVAVPGAPGPAHRRPARPDHQPADRAANSQASGSTAAATSSLVDGEVLASRAGTSTSRSPTTSRRRGRAAARPAGARARQAHPGRGAARGRGARRRADRRAARAALEEAQAAKERVEGGEDFADVASRRERRLHRPLRRRAGLVRGRRRRLRRVLRRAGRRERGRPRRADRDRSRRRGPRARRAPRGDRRGPLVATCSSGNGISDEARTATTSASDILVDAYREHFETRSSSRPAPQRRVAQIFIAR